MRKLTLIIILFIISFNIINSSNLNSILVRNDIITLNGFDDDNDIPELVNC